MKFAVMGAGAVGCYYGALLARAGHTVCLIGRPQHVEAVNQHGLRLESPIFDGYLPMRATTQPNGVQDADVVLLCVKSAATEDAGRAMAPFLKADAVVICLQNGVDNAERLQATVSQVVVPAAVYVATEMVGPGHVKHNGRGELVIGASAQSAAIADVLRGAGVPTTISETVRDALWVKLVANCCYNALSAVSQLPYGRMIAVEGTRDVMCSIVEECVAVANAAGVSMPEDILAITLAIADAMPNQYSSTAQDMARGRPTEIDYLNGTVVRTGAQLGVPTPVNRLLQTLVTLKEAARERPS
jgi:2-dehydropantoate 2-reductase